MILTGAVLFNCLSPFQVQAQITRTWSPQGSSNDWHLPTNWFPFGVPNGLDDVVSDNGIRRISLINGPSLAVDNLTLTNGARLFTDGGSLTINNADDTGLLRLVGSGSELRIDDTNGNWDANVDAVSVEVGANLNLDGGTMRIDRVMQIDSSSRITGFGSVQFLDSDQTQPPLVMTLNGAIRPVGGLLEIMAQADSEVEFSGAHLDAGYGDLFIDANLDRAIDATVTVGEGHSIYFEKRSQFADTSVINLFGGDYSSPAMLDGAEVTFIAARLNVHNSGLLLGHARLTKSSETNLLASNDELRFGGTGIIHGNIIDENETGATFTGDGQIVNESETVLYLMDGPIIDVHFQNKGNMDLGFVAFILFSDVSAVEFASFEQTDSGTMNYDIGQIGDDIFADRHSVRGSAILDGVLEVGIVEIGSHGFPELEAGDTFEIIAADGGVFGEFSTTSFPTPPAGLAWRLEYNLHSVVLVLVEEDTIVVPQTFTVLRGTHASGDAGDLGASDNSDVALRRSPTDIQSRTLAEITAISPIAAPSRMKVTLEGAVFARSNVQQIIQLFDYDNSSWEIVDSRSAGQLVDSVVELTVSDGLSGDATRFVQSGTNEMKARVLYRSTNPRQSFTSYTDQFMWAVGN